MNSNQRKKTSPRNTSARGVAIRRVAIIGAGEIGMALAHVLSAQKRASLVLWDRSEGRVPNQRPLREIISTADALFLCTPSWALRDVLQSIVPHLTTHATIITISKGIERDTQKVSSEIVGEFLAPHGQCAVMSGPMIAEELMADRRGFAVFATLERSVFALFEKVFSGTLLTIEYADDPRSVAFVGALKNIYAVVLGIVDGFAWGTNTKGMLFTRALKEMETLMQAYGCNPSYVYSTAGAADLAATGWSDGSKNRAIGESLATNGACAIQGEGIASLHVVAVFARQKKISVPILDALEMVVTQYRDVKKTFSALLKHGV